MLLKLCKVKQFALLNGGLTQFLYISREFNANLIF